MVKELSSAARGATDSATMALNARAAKMKKEGKDVISFAVGEPDFDTPEHIKQAGISATASGKTKYTPAAGTPELRAKIADMLQQTKGLKYAPADQIVVSNGGKQTLWLALQVLLGYGDQAIIPAPYWVSYPEMVRVCGGQSVIVETSEDDGFLLTAEALEEAITPLTKVLILCSPSNPTGGVYTESRLREVMKVAMDRDLWVLSDEIYEHLIYDDARHVSPATLGQKEYDHVIISSGVSKTYAMTGWRIGWLAGPKDVITGASRLQSNLTSAPNTMAQYAAQAALEGDQSKVEEFRRTFDARRKLLVRLLNEIPGVSCHMPKGAFYAFANVQRLIGRRHKQRTIDGSLKLSELLLVEKLIAVTDGASFGAEGYLRFSYATSEDRIAAGVKRFKEFVAEMD